MTLLQIKNLSHYFGGLLAVDNLNEEIREGELIGLIGPNGAGKTTVFNLITGVYRPTQGDIIFQGQSLVGKAPHTINALGISRTFQTIRLWNMMSVLDNVRIAHHSRIRYNLAEAFLHLPRYRHQEREIEERSMELLRLFRLDRYAHEPVKNLPYGEQRRVEIVRALASQPRLLLLDEPAAGMNPREIGALMEFIHWIRDEFHLTIWLIEHQMRLVMNICERIKVLDFGATIADGTPEEVRSNPRVIEAYLGEQAEVH
jgi:branched-chain amino acid transport system ATP-binding protein